MPKNAQYIVSWSAERMDYFLTEPENAAHCPLQVEGDGWQKWLEGHHAFAFHGPTGQINLLKERRSRGGAGYWYAYRRQQGEMLKRYVGRSEGVNVQALEEVEALLAQGETAARGTNRSEASALPTRRSSLLSSDTRRVDLPQMSWTQGVGDGNISRSSSDNDHKNTLHTPDAAQFEPLLLPKLQLPRLQKGLLPRERLVELLDAGLERTLILIAGPAGYGKTTLVSQWISARSTDAHFPRVASVTLDEGDNDAISFWRYILAACEQFQPGFGKEARELLLAHRLPPFKPLQMMLTSLLNELSTLDHPALLILDDFHVIHAPQVRETLSFFLDHLPTSFHLVLLIRGDPPFSLARLRARNEMLDIYPPLLAFSSAETRLFFEQELPFELSPKLLRQIYARMDGWPAGLRLIGREMHQSENAEEVERILSASAGSHWGIQEYFLNEVLRTLPSEQQEFLLETSILPRITAPLCNSVTGRTDGEQQLATLRGQDLFLIPLDTTGTWGRYVFLFAEAMQLEARRRLGEQHLQQIAARASVWYEEHGFLIEAIESALNAGEFARSALLIEQFAQSKQRGPASTVPELHNLQRWLERLPVEELERNPTLCLHYALILLFLLMENEQATDDNKRLRIYSLLQLAEQHWRDANNTEQLAGVFAFRALLARQEGRILQAVTWAKQSLAWLPAEEQTWRNLDLTVVGIGELLDGHLDKAQALLLEALALSERLGNVIYARATRGMLSWVSAERGELRTTAEQLRQMQIEARAQNDRDDIVRTQLGLASILYQWNRLAEAEQAAQEALALGEAMNVEEFQAQAVSRLALIERARGQPAQAQQRLTAWLTHKQTVNSPASYQLLRELQVVQMRIGLATGDQSIARRTFDTSAQPQETLPRVQRLREQLLQARLLLSQQESDAALELLESLHASALQTGHTYLKMEIQVVQVRAYAQQGKQKIALQHLRELLESAASEGYLRLFLDEGAIFAELLRKLLPSLSEKPLRAYAQHMLSLFSQESTAPSVETEPGDQLFIEPLSPQEKKVLRLLAAGNANAEIARELVVSVNTVRTQIQSIYRKLNVNNRIEASAVAAQLQLV